MTSCMFFCLAKKSKMDCIVLLQRMEYLSLAEKGSHVLEVVSKEVVVKISCLYFLLQFAYIVVSHIFFRFAY